MVEVRAADIEVGQTIREHGMDPITVRALRLCGDSVLLDGTEGQQAVLDRDTVIELVIS